MQALILCAGYGTRLYPLTLDRPKALLDICGKPLILYILESLDHPDIDSVIISSNRKFYKQFEDFLGSESYKKSIKKRIELVEEPSCSEEDRLGSIGSIHYVITYLNIKQDLLILGSDNLFFGLSIKDLLNFFYKTGSSVLVAYDGQSIERIRNKYGVLNIDGNFKIVEFEEKPAQPRSTLISTACYLLSKKDLDLLREYVKEGRSLDKLGNFIEYLVERSQVYALVFSGVWFDIGSFDDYAAAQQYITSQKNAH